MTRTTKTRAVLCALVSSSVLSALVSTGCSSTNAAEKARRNAATSNNEIPAPAPADLKHARVGFIVFPNLLGSIDSTLKLLGPPLAIGLTSQGLLRSLLQGSQTPESFIASVAFHRPIAILLLRDDALAGQKPALLRIELRDVELFRQSLSQLAQVHERTPWGTDIYQMSDGPLHVAIRDRVAYAGSSAELVAAAPAELDGIAQAKYDEGSAVRIAYELSHTREARLSGAWSNVERLSADVMLGSNDLSLRLDFQIAPPSTTTGATPLPAPSAAADTPWGLPLLDHALISYWAVPRRHAPLMGSGWLGQNETFALLAAALQNLDDAAQSSVLNIAENGPRLDVVLAYHIDAKRDVTPLTKRLLEEVPSLFNAKAKGRNTAIKRPKKIRLGRLHATETVFEVASPMLQALLGKRCAVVAVRDRNLLLFALGANARRIAQQAADKARRDSRAGPAATAGVAAWTGPTLLSRSSFDLTATLRLFKAAAAVVAGPDSSMPPEPALPSTPMARLPPVTMTSAMQGNSVIYQVNMSGAVLLQLMGFFMGAGSASP